MHLYKNYIFRSIIYPFITFTITLVTFIWVTQVLKLLYLLDKGIRIVDFLKLITLVIPSLFFMISPLISVFAIIYTYNRVQESRELVILQASGLSNYSIARPALVFCALVTLLSFYTSFHLMPISYNKLKSELASFRERYISTIIDERTFSQISKNITIYFNKKNSNKVLEGIILFDNEFPERRSILFARNGKVIVEGNNMLFYLQDGFRQDYDKNNNLTTLNFEKLLVEVKNDNPDTASRSRTSLELFIDEMLWPEQNLGAERKAKLRIDAHQRISWPLFNFCLPFLALSIFLSYPYSRKYSIKLFGFTFFPLIVVTYLHFAIQKISYQHPDAIYLCYLNLLLGIAFSIWQNRRKTL